MLVQFLWAVSFRFIFMDRKRKLISFGFSFFWSKILYRNKYFILIRFYKKWREDMMHEKKKKYLVLFEKIKKKTSKFISNFSKFFHFNKHIWCYTPKKILIQYKILFYLSPSSKYTLYISFLFRNIRKFNLNYVYSKSKFYSFPFSHFFLLQNKVEIWML